MSYVFLANLAALPLVLWVVFPVHLLSLPTCSVSPSFRGLQSHIPGNPAPRPRLEGGGGWTGSWMVGDQLPPLVVLP